MTSVPAIGSAIPLLERTVTRAVVESYADASGDRNPLHLDDEFASTTAFGGVIAHGMITVAYVSQAMHLWLGNGWASGGALNVSFLKPVRPGDHLAVRGTVTGAEPDPSGRARVTCAIEVTNERAETVLAGTASGLWT